MFPRWPDSAGDGDRKVVQRRRAKEAGRREGTREKRKMEQMELNGFQKADYEISRSHGRQNHFGVGHCRLKLPI